MTIENTHGKKFLPWQRKIRIGFSGLRKVTEIADRIPVIGNRLKRKEEEETQLGYETLLELSVQKALNDISASGYSLTSANSSVLSELFICNYRKVGDKCMEANLHVYDDKERQVTSCRIEDQRPEDDAVPFRCQSIYDSSIHITKQPGSNTEVETQEGVLNVFAGFSMLTKMNPDKRITFLRRFLTAKPDIEYMKKEVSRRQSSGQNCQWVRNRNQSLPKITLGDII